jgi:phage shock protein A
MTIDERREKLADRHEALSQRAELLLADGEKTAEKIKTPAIVADQNEVPAAEMMDAIASLARTFEQHERHLDNPGEHP